MVSELLRRLKVNKVWSLELVLSSFLINILALGSSLYSIQVLNRYMALGIDSTLLTLTLGVLITVSFEILLRKARLKLTQVICQKSDDTLMKLVFTGLGLSEYKTMARHSLGQRKEVLSGLQNVIQAFNAVNLNNLMDAPFCLVFLTALYWISPKLTAYMVLLILAVSALSLLYHARMRTTHETQTQQSVKHSQLMQFLVSHLETIRTFNAQNYVLNRWNEDFNTSYQTRVRLQNEQNEIGRAHV